MLLILSATMHCIVALSFVFSPLPIWLRTLAVLVAAFSLWRGWRIERNKQFCRLTLHADGRAHCAANGAERGKAMNVVRGVDGGIAVWLTWRSSGRWRRQSLMLVADNVEHRDDWRALRIWLRLLAATPVADCAQESRVNAPSDASRGA